MKAKYALLGTLYFVQGLPYGLQSGLLPVFLRSAGLSLTRISLAKALYLPWVLKVLWAPCVDRCGALRAWLALSMAGLALACLACAALSPETDFLPLALALGVMNLLASLQDVAVDGVAVQLLARDEVGHGNAIQVVAYKLGSVLAGGGMLAVLHRVGWRTLFCLLAAVYLVAVLYVCKAPVLRLLPRPPSWESQAPAGTLEPRRIVREVLHVPGTPWTAGFVLLYKLGEQGAATMFPLFLLDHGFTPQQLGLWNGMVAVACSILGSSLGGQLMSRQRQPLALLKTLLLLRFCGLSLQTLLLLAYDPHISLLGAAAVLSLCVQHLFGGLVTTLTFSAMMQCTQRADTSIQATHYSVLAALEVLGKLAFSTVVGGLVDQLGFGLSFGGFLLLSLGALLYVLGAPPAGS
ncbi:major facilitator superfamily domain-containing protein 3 [Alligator mississippiensis]|uniref:Major facilitator superfamily domain-containing protein 3 n=1 Tax=Alligator mississippiensis TaxID=8496 RepID=A0A151NJV8_ALLMI|nr:major facilitator superfamily domain-containing protein 3 [Alligator mississippiensis]